MFLDALEKILVDHCSSADIRRVEAGGSAAVLWQQIEEAGFLDLLLKEEQGGAALPLPELFPILECLGRVAVPVPLAQSIVARALVGATLPTGMVTMATQLRRTGDGTELQCQWVPYGMNADHVLARDGDALLLFPCATAQREALGDPRNLSANLRWHKPEPVFGLPAGGELLSALAAAAAAALLSGAMQRTFDMTLGHCNNRVQFGKTISKFQAIQQQLSVMAEHVLAAAIAAESAFRSSATAPTLLAAAVAKSRTSEAAGQVAATAHALHGAIGMTEEYELGILTRRLHNWRMTYGAEGYWNRMIGLQVLATDTSLVDFVTSL